MPPAFSEPHKLKQTRVCLTPFTRLTPTGFAAHLIVEQIACPPLPPCGQQIMFSTRTTKIPLLLPPALYDRRFFFCHFGFRNEFPGQRPQRAGGSGEPLSSGDRRSLSC